MMRRQLAWTAFVLCCSLLVPRPLQAAPRVYVIAVGNNEAPEPREGEERLSALAFADDDAAAFYEFAGSFAHQRTVLSLLDARSQRRFPGVASAARAPSVGELEATIRRHVEWIRGDQARGDSAELIFFFSGHGSTSGRLQLLDGAITREWLYERLLGALPVRYLHLLVDACHAELVVRPRDVSAEVVEVTKEQARAWLDGSTLRRFAHVGAVVATAGDQQTHEWTAYEQGVFTHQVLSGLRGAADVNGDRRIEYSELHAFLAAANRDIADPRAKLRVVVHAPRLNQRVSLVDLTRPRGGGWAVGATSSLGHFYLESETGERLLDAHLEPGYQARFLLPSDTTLYLRSGKKEAAFRLASMGEVQLGRLAFRPPETRARGSIASALQRGLFQTAYGPLYYRGFVDRVGDLSVVFPRRSVRPATRPGPSRTPAYVAWASSGALLTGAAILGGLALSARADWNRTELQRHAEEANQRYDAYRYAFFAALGAGAAAGLLGTWLYPWRSASSGGHTFAMVPGDSGVMGSWAGTW